MDETITAMAKSEVAIPIESCCARAFLSALVHSAGSIIISDRGIKIEVISNNARLLRAATKLFFECFGVRASVKGKVLSVDYGARDILCELGILDPEEAGIERGIKEEIVKKPCCKQSYLKGVFMGTGTVFALKKGGYHLEFALTDIEFADAFASLLYEEGILARIRIKKDKPMVYVKAMDSVSDFLALVGAGGAVVRINSLAAERQMRGIANRNENCDLANIEKTVNASMSLIGKLEGITDKIEDRELRETAEVRIANPDATYAQLASILGISKSGLAHRLKKLKELAEKAE